MTQRHGSTRGSHPAPARDLAGVDGSPSEPDHHRRALAREALASALYLAVVLLATLVAVPRTRLPADRLLVELIIGGGFGLVLAHWVAFRLAVPVTSRGAWSVAAAQEGTAAMAGGLVTAALAALPFLILDGDAAITCSVALLAAIPALAGGLSARLRGHSWGRTLLTALLALGLTAVAVVTKIVLQH